jgi:hypothetical protein
MFDFLPRLAVERPVLTTMMVVTLLVLGLFSYTRLRVDLFPDVEVFESGWNRVFNGASAGGFGFMAISLIGFDNAYPELNLDDFLTADGRAAFSAMTNGDCALDLLLSYADAELLDYTDPSPFTSPAWLRRITENELGRAPINVPVFQYHATTDGIVPFPQARQLQRSYCSAGVELTWKEYDTSSLGASTAAHTSPISWANDEVMEFLADRFAGRATSTTC